MKSILKKLASIVLMLSLLLAAGASAATFNTAWVTVPSSYWEAVFSAVVTNLEMNDDPVFTVTEYPDYESAYRFGHALDINDFMRITYYDDGSDVFNSAVLEIDLSYPDIPSEQAWGAVFAAIVSGDPDSTQEQWTELMNAICPAFDDVLTGKERLNGAQSATLNGIGYMLELNDDAKLARFFTSATLTPNDAE